ncbi:MAG: enoyl-CoA hydratase/isomerase family protein [Bacteroidales bacterium]|nr:enoyl-CoA hydratase/isomerase family protein [Bacteroidales bacterium]
MNYNTLKFEAKENIGILTISRPEALNALNSEVFNDLNSFLDQFETMENMRVLIITGEGKAFVAGADIAEMSNFASKEGKEFSEKGQDTFCRLEALSVPVIAAINGFALGGGMELAMSCDFRIASSKAKLGQPEVNLGLIPGYAGTQRLSRLAGIGDALFILMTGEMIKADQALAMRLVQKVVEPEELMPETLKIASIIASKGKNAVKQVKYVTRQGTKMMLNAGQKLEADVFGSMFDTYETKEGINAFLQKRNPNW